MSALLLLNILWKSTLLFLLVLCLARSCRRARTRASLWQAYPFVVLIVCVAEVWISATQTPRVLELYAPDWISDASAAFESLQEQGTTDDSPSTTTPVSPLLSRTWFVGALIGFLVQVITLVRLRAWRLESLPLTADECGSLMPHHATHRRIDVRWSDRLSVPVTWGLHKHVILLPNSAKSWPQKHVAMALDHELEHIARNDFRTLQIAMFLRALFWPLPWIHIALNNWREEREGACDEGVLARGVNPYDYGQVLLDLGRAPAMRPKSVVALAPAARIEKRLRAILAWRPASGRGAMLPLVALFVIATLTCCVGGARDSSRVHLTNAKSDEAGLRTVSGNIEEVHKDHHYGFTLKQVVIDSNGAFVTLKPGGSLRVFEKRRGVTRTLHAAAASHGEITVKFERNGQAIPFDEAASRWLNGLLQEARLGT